MYSYVGNLWFGLFERIFGLGKPSCFIGFYWTADGHTCQMLLEALPLTHYCILRPRIFFRIQTTSRCSRWKTASDHTRCSMVARSGEIHRNSFADQPTLASSCTCSDIEFLSYSRRRRRRRKRARRRRRHGSREWSRRTLNAARTCAFALRQCGLDGYPYITARAGRSGKLLYLTVLPTARRRRSRRHWRCKRRGWRKNIFVGTHARTHARSHASCSPPDRAVDRRPKGAVVRRPRPRVD